MCVGGGGGGGRGYASICVLAYSIYVCFALAINLIINVLPFHILLTFSIITLCFQSSKVLNMKLAYECHTIIISLEGDMASQRCKCVYFNNFQRTFYCHIRSTVRDTGRGSGRQRIFTSEEGQGYDEIKVKQRLNQACSWHILLIKIITCLSYFV